LARYSDIYDNIDLPSQAHVKVKASQGSEEEILPLQDMTATGNTQWITKTTEFHVTSSEREHCR